MTVSCAEGDEGVVYDGIARDFEERKIESRRAARRRAPDVMLNLANPAAAFRWWRLPAGGVGLARMEFIIGNHISIHPMALVRYAESRR
ncbi:MAG: hypothetical protein U5K56_00080 [Halioglobus sp.]|nr:hypothetical protein [Halioglobus sp.]